MKYMTQSRKIVFLSLAFLVIHTLPNGLALMATLAPGANPEGLHGAEMLARRNAEAAAFAGSCHYSCLCVMTKILQAYGINPLQPHASIAEDDASLSWSDFDIHTLKNPELSAMADRWEMAKLTRQNTRAGMVSALRLNYDGQNTVLTHADLLELARQQLMADPHAVPCSCYGTNSPSCTINEDGVPHMRCLVALSFMLLQAHEPEQALSIINGHFGGKEVMQHFGEFGGIVHFNNLLAAQTGLGLLDLAEPRKPASFGRWDFYGQWHRFALMIGNPRLHELLHKIISSVPQPQAFKRRVRKPLDARL